MIAIVGGTGPEGRGLALRWSLAGEEVCIGSRSEERANQTVTELRERWPTIQLQGGANETVVENANFVVVALPYGAVRSTMIDLAPRMMNRIVVSVVASIDWVAGRPRPVAIPAGSVAEEIAEILPTCRVTSAFQTLSAEKLQDAGIVLEEDTIVCGDDSEARHEVMALAETIPNLRAISGGRLAASCYSEQFVGMLAVLNRIYKSHTGLFVVGVNRS